MNQKYNFYGRTIKLNCKVINKKHIKHKKGKEKSKEKSDKLSVK